MSMMNTGDILETIEMFTQDNLDVRTVTMGISLLDCIDPDPKKACEKVYNKIVTKAANLVPAVEHISAEYGIPIINKRISVTPIAMLLGACPDADPVDFAKALDAAGKKVGVNFVGGYTALVHKGFSAGDLRLIESIPRALAETDIVCSSVNIGATKAGLNMDAIKRMGEAVKKASELTADRQCIGAAKLVVFCNAPEDNPFMAGAFHGPGEPDCEIHVGVSGPGAVRAALAKLPKDAPIDEVAELVKRTAFKITRVGQLVANLASKALGSGMLLLPLQTWQDAYALAPTELALAVPKGEKAGELADDVLAKLHNLPGKYLSVTLENEVDAAKSVVRIFVMVLACVAFVCVATGAIGVMNVLLISVRERRREIGLLKAIGATSRQVALLFLLEAAAYASLGGLLGILLGLGMTALFGALIGLMPQVKLLHMGLLLAGAAVLGLSFGVIPAAKAAGLPPAQALRTE